MDTKCHVSSHKEELCCCMGFRLNETHFFSFCFAFLVLSNVMLLHVPSVLIISSVLLFYCVGVSVHVSLGKDGQHYHGQCYLCCMMMSSNKENHEKEETLKWKGSRDKPRNVLITCPPRFKYFFKLQRGFFFTLAVFLIFF